MGLDSNSISLLFRAQGETSDARKAFSELRTSINNDISGIEGKGQSGFANLAQSMGISEASATKLAGAIPVVGAVVAGLATGIATAAVGLFNLAESASDFGSKIHDASDKTGLSAATLSSLKVAADQSGSSLEAVTGGMAKFAKTIGEAGDGSDKAKEKLAKLGVTSNDLDTALGQALATISKYPPGVEQMTAAQAAFGKSGADLLPFIKSFDGDLPGLIEKCKQLGLTMTDENAKAADEFGDTLDTLKEQASAAGRDFAFGFMPQITRAMGSVSQSVAANKDLWRDWGNYIGDTVSGTIVLVRGLDGAISYAFGNVNGQLDKNEKSWVSWAENAMHEINRVMVAIESGGLTEIHNLAPAAGNVPDIVKDATDRMKKRLVESQKAPEYHGIWSPEGQKKLSDLLWDNAEKAADAAKKAAEDAKAAREKAARDASAQAEKDARDAERAAEKARIQAATAAEHAMQQQLAIYRAGYAERTAILDGELKRGVIKESQYARDVNRIRLEALEDEKRLDQELIKNENLTTEQRLALQNRIKVLDIEIRTQKIETSTAVTAAINKETEATDKQTEAKRKQADAEERLRIERARSWSEYVQQEQKRQDIEDARKAQQGAENSQVTAPGTVGGGIAQSLGVKLISIFSPGQLNQLKTQAQYVKDVYADVKNFAGEAIGSMISGLANLVSQWLVTGEFSGKAALQMASSIALSLALQAGVKAIFELAEGWAAAASFPFNPLGLQQAAMHFTAAGIYGTVAGVAAAVGVGTGLLGRAVGGQSSGNAAFGDQSSAATANTQHSQNGGKIYSGYGDDTQVVEGGNTAGNRIGLFGLLKVEVTSKDSHIVNVVKDNINSTGVLRDMILKNTY